MSARALIKLHNELMDKYYTSLIFIIIVFIAFFVLSLLIIYSIFVKEE